MGRKSKKGKTKAIKRKKTAGKGSQSDGLLMQKTWRIYGFPFLLTIVILPLLIRGYSFANTLCLYQPAEAGEKYSVDYFLHCKEMALFAIAGLVLFLWLSLLLLGRKPDWSNMQRGRLFCLLLPGCYVLMGLLSSLFSSYHGIVFRGAKDLFQPFPVLLCYGILFYYGWYVTAAGESQRDEFLHYIIRCCSLSVCFLGIIGILQLLGHDPMAWSFVRRLCGLDQAEILASSRIYLTLYHADYVGVYLSMMLPLIVSGLMTESGKVWKGIYFISLVLDLISLFGSQSRSGILAAIIGCLFFGASMFAKGIKGSGESERKMKVGPIPVISLIAAGICLIFGVLTAVNHMTGGDLMGRLFRYQEMTKSAKGRITGIRTEEDGSILEVDGGLIQVSWKADDGQMPMIRTETGETVENREASERRKKALQKALKKRKISADALKGPVYRLIDPPFDNLYFWRDSIRNSSGEKQGYVFYDGDYAWFLCQNEGRYQLLNHQGVLADSVISPDALPPSSYGFASYRGYVWSKTIAGLARVPFLGTGPDTFSLFFPNNDYAGRHQIGQDDVIYNKPHCWYLQMAAETGLLSAFIMTVYLVLYLLRFSKILSCIGDRNLFFTGLGFLLGPALYMITGLANDSMIVTAPVFWALLGLGEGILFQKEKEVLT